MDTTDAAEEAKDEPIEEAPTVMGRRSAILENSVRGLRARYEELTARADRIEKLLAEKHIDESDAAVLYRSVADEMDALPVHSCEATLRCLCGHHDVRITTRARRRARTRSHD